jgi:hypothetical protein
MPTYQANTTRANFIAFLLSDPILLLDSSSTLNLVADETLLHDIHKVNKTMHVRCNVGVTTMNLMGWLGDFPEPVWFNPKGVANILSLFIVMKYYHVKLDSKKDSVITSCLSPLEDASFAIDGLNYQCLKRPLLE